MPELPEVETMVRGIRDSILGCELHKLKRCRCSRKPITISPDFAKMRKLSEHATATAVERLGKRVLIALDNGWTFVIEPRMTGLMLLGDPPSGDHLRLEWQWKNTGDSDSHSVWFWDRRGLGTVRLLSGAELTELRDNALGPDALTFRLPQWKALRGRTARPIKVALLDQKLVAGIGNLYASEILHHARISPLTATNQLTDSDLKRLSRATKHVLETAIRYEGSTLSDGTYRNALNRDGSYQNEHRVYMRAEETCLTCEQSPIVRIVQAQRSTFYCAICQPDRG